MLTFDGCETIIINIREGLFLVRVKKRYIWWPEKEEWTIYGRNSYGSGGQ